MATQEEIVKKLEEYKILNITDTEDENELTKNFEGKNSSQIARYLKELRVDEVGGITAMTGFYYQFLVTIEYVIQMLENKWDYILMEHHDDIVAVKDKHIKFIQVKSSQEVTVGTNEKPARDLYDRSVKTINEITFKRNNSWVDKLISKAMIAPKDYGFTSEFELYASYHFIKKNNHNFDFHTNKKNLTKKIPNNDDLLKIINESVCDKDGNPYDYKEQCGEGVSELLTRFNIYTGFNLHKIDAMKNDLCMKLNNLIFQGISDNFTMKSEDLNMLIGALFERCTSKNDKELLVINRDTVLSILDTIRIKTTNAAKKDLDSHESSSLLEKIFNNIQSEYEEHPPHKDFLTDKLYDYKEYILNWVSDEKGDIKELIERYLEGTTRTPIYSKLDGTSREGKLKEFLQTILILNLSRDSLLTFKESSGLIIKESVDINEKFSFLSPESEKDLQYAIDYLDNEFSFNNIKKHIESITDELYVILNHYFDPTFEEIYKWEKSVVNSIEELDEGDTILDVPTNIFIVPGKKIDYDFKLLIRKEEDITIGLKGKWENYERGF